MNLAYFTAASELARAQKLLEVTAFHIEEKPKDSVELKVLPRPVAELYRYAGIHYLDAVKRLVRCFLTSMFLCLALLFLDATPWFFLGVSLPWVFEFFIIKRKKFVRAETFEKDYTALLLSLASAVRTGLDPLQALCHSPDLFPDNSEMKKELLTFKSNIEAGVDEENAIQAFGSSISHSDIKLFGTAFLLARRQGSSLAQCLQRLSKVTRQRQSFRRKMKAAVAMQRLSSFGIVACTFVIATIQFATNPQALKEALAHPTGIKLIGVGAALILGGLFWMLRLTKPRI